jgi:tetrahydromethanopterin S-methyltransferase subunit G
MACTKKNMTKIVSTFVELLERRDKRYLLVGREVGLLVGREVGREVGSAVGLAVG